MRALIFDGQSIRLSSAHVPPVGAPGMAIVRLIRAGIGALDIEVCRGLCQHNGVLGHQFVGVVESIHDPAGKREKHAKLVGKRVVGSQISACSQCDMCLSGLSEHCRGRTIMGFGNVNGCLAERFSVPITSLVAVPDSIDDDHAVFALELSWAIQASRRLTIERKPFVTVIGDGSLALLMVQVMSQLNTSVRLVGFDHQQLSICEKLGIKHRHQDEVGRRADQDVVVECTGRSEQFELATELLRPRGTIILTALSAGSARITPQRVVLNELQIIGSFTNAPMGEALGMLARTEIDVVSLISRRMSLNDGAAILKLASQRGMTKVLVEP